MIHKPQPGTKQSAESMISDLQAQRLRLDDSISWAQSAVAGIKAASMLDVTTTSFITAETTQVGVAIAMKAGQFVQDVEVFSLICQPDAAALEEMRRVETPEALRLLEIILWKQAYGVQPFDSWLIDKPVIWQGSPDTTQVLLVQQVKAWLSYWFPGLATPVRYRARKMLEATALGRRLPAAVPARPG